MFKISRFRDLTIMEEPAKTLVVACDSIGAIGNKPHDIVAVDPYIVGRFLVRVPLMELISVGANPVAVFNTLAVEMEPTGRSIITGIVDEMRQSGMDGGELINGSTEDNMPTVQTGAGVTIIGEASEIFAKSAAGDMLCCIGYPKVGNEVKLDDPDICDLPTMQQLRAIAGVHEIVPVGSKGIRYEAGELLRRNQLACAWSDTQLPVDKSAGPGTCAIVTVKKQQLDLLKKLNRPVFILGSLDAASEPEGYGKK